MVAFQRVQMIVKKAAISIAAIAALIGPAALAADMAPPPALLPPPPSAWSFTGCYLGGNAGGVWGNSAFNWTNISEGPTGFAAGASSVLPAAANATLSTVGVAAGGQVGCNYQAGWVVAGLEGDLDYTGLNASRTAVSLGNTNGGPPTITPGNISESFSSHWLSTVRGRLGVTSGAWLYYATGGLAIANVSFADQVCFPSAVPASCNTASSSNTRTGWAAGGGIEWKIASSWNVKAEYLYVDLGNSSYNSVNTSTLFPGATITHNHNLTDNILRIGFNYQFSWGPGWFAQY